MHVIDEGGDDADLRTDVGGSLLLCSLPDRNVLAAVVGIFG